MGIHTLKVYLIQNQIKSKSNKNLKQFIKDKLLLKARWVDFGDFEYFLIFQTLKRLSLVHNEEPISDILISFIAIQEKLRF